MIYQDNSGLTISEMSEYVDNHVYTENPDVETIYKYLYLIIYRISKNLRYFKYNADYDKFSIYMSGRIYMRLTSKGQFTYNENGEPKVEKVKSCLKYIKQTMNIYRIRYQQEEYAQTISEKEHPYDVEFSFNNVLNTYVNKLNCMYFDISFRDIPKTCKAFLSTIPYDKKSSTWLNIYVSVLMTLLNRLTPRDEMVENIKKLQKKNKCKNYHISQLYEELDKIPPVLYHLPDHMSNYIDVLCRQLKHIISKDLSEIYNTNISSEIIPQYDIIKEVEYKDEDFRPY